MNSYQKSLELGLTGTDEQIVDILKCICNNNITSKDVAIWMREKGLWIMLPDGCSGTLYNLYSQTDNQEIKTGLGEWYASTLSGQAENILATDPIIAQRIASIIYLISNLIPNGPEICEEFYAMCGGRPFLNLSVEQFSADRQAYIDVQNLNSVEPEWTDTSILLSINLNQHEKKY